MNPGLQHLQPHPLEKLQRLLAGVAPNPHLDPIDLSVGEPKHPTPSFIADTLRANLHELARYPSTVGNKSLRQAIADWLKRRHQIVQIDPDTQVVPTLGSREAIFSLAQAVSDSSQHEGWVVCPNPFYPIYEGAALLAGLRPYFINTRPEADFCLDWSRVPEAVWQRVQLVFTCSPGNPTGAVMALDEWRELFSLSDRYGFIVAADECYTEIYPDEENPPLGALAAAERLGRHGFPRLVVLGSLSKRSNVPGLRSGFAAGDAAIVHEFTRYRTYHGSAMGGAIQAASEVAWNDEAHVRENRRLYREKSDLFYKIVHPVLPLARPAATFYYWVAVPIDDREFAVRLFQEANVVVMPGHFLARDFDGVHPGQNRIRIALVAPVDMAVEAAHRMRRFVLQRPGPASWNMIEPVC